jgi:hypothetical protein
MSDNELEVFPRAYIAQGNGDLVKVTNLSWGIQNGAKIKHTLRKPGAGATVGPSEVMISFDFLIGEDGFERDYIRDCQQGNIRQLRTKVPGGAVLTTNGVYQSVDLDGPLDDAVKGSCKFVAALEEQRRSLVT